VVWGGGNGDGEGYSKGGGGGQIPRDINSGFGGIDGQKRRNKG